MLSDAFCIFSNCFTYANIFCVLFFVGILFTCAGLVISHEFIIENFSKKNKMVEDR